MNIIYKQSDNHDICAPFSAFGVSNCYLKHIVYKNRMNYNKKLHHHTTFEIHAVISGEQKYEVLGEEICIEAGSFLLIAPFVPHRALNFNEGTVKLAYFFSVPFNFGRDYYLGSFGERVLSNLDFILKESKGNKRISPYLVSGAVLETLVMFLRRAGISEETGAGISSENLTLQIAKQYIKDNIDYSPTVLDVSAYCYLSEKQLTRIFDQEEGVTPGNYIKHLRAKRLEELLSSSDLSLREISEKMNFSSEYYFNSFFKKNVGMSPGTYRKAHKK